MAFEFVTFFTLMTAALAASQYNTDHHYEHESSSPVFIKNNNIPVYKEHKGPVNYEFSYSVHDDYTKDIKNQIESRKDDLVKGHYDMIDSDGYKRIVDYTADDKNGFQAIVYREKTDIHVPTPTVTYHQKPYYHALYPEHSLEHHHTALPVHSTGQNKSYLHTAVYSEHSREHHHVELPVHTVESNKPYHPKVYAEHSLEHHHTALPVHSTGQNKSYLHTAVYPQHSREHHHMELPVDTVELNKPYHHKVYAEHSLEHHHMAIPALSESNKSHQHTVVYPKHSRAEHNHTELPVDTLESNKPYHHKIYSEHSLKHHHMSMPVHYAKPYKSAIVYSVTKKPVLVNKHEEKSVEKQSNYFLPIEYQTMVPVKISSAYYVDEPTKKYHHAKTHVSFHGVNTKYEY